MENTETLAASKPSIKSPYLNRHFVKQNLKFLRRSLAYNTKPILIHGAINRSQLCGFSRVFQKTGECHLFVFEQYEEYNTDIVSKELSRIKNVRNLSLEFRDCRSLRDTGIEAIAAAIRQMKYLRSLKLVFTGGDNIFDPAIRSIIQSIARCHFLESLNIQFIVMHFMADEALLDLESLKSLTHLKNFALNLDFCFSITDQSIKRLANLVGGLKQLESFHLSILNRSENGNEGSIESIANLLNHLASAQNLKAVSLLLKGWKCASPREGLLAECLAKLTKLKSLTLAPVREWAMTDEVLVQICSAIAGMTSLRHLDIDFEGCEEVTDMKPVANMLENMKELKSINFVFTGLYGCTNDSIKLLGESLCKLGKLRSINLNLKFCKAIQDKGIEILLNGIGQNSELEELQLRFGDQFSLGKNTFLSIQKHIAVLKMLKTFVIGVDQGRIDDPDILPLCEGLESMTSLRNVFINLTNCDDICSIGVTSISKSLKKLTDLEELTLYIRNCAKITNDPIHELSKTLSNMPRLRALSIVFYEASHVDDDGIEELCNAISGLFKLTSLTFDFSWAWIITPKSLNTIKNMLNKFRNLEHCEVSFAQCKMIEREANIEMKDSLRKSSRISNII